VVLILRELEPLARHGRFVFPSLLSRDRPMSNNTINTALRRLGYTSNEQTRSRLSEHGKHLTQRAGLSPRRH